MFYSCFSSVGHDTEKILLSAWSHPLLNKPTNPDPSPVHTEVQSDPLSAVGDAIQLDVELVKVEVVVMAEDEQEQVEETVIGETMSAAEEQEASNQSSEEGGDECVTSPVNLEVDR